MENELKNSKWTNNYITNNKLMSPTKSLTLSIVNFVMEYTSEDTSKAPREVIADILTG